MPGLIVDGKEYSVPGLEIINFRDNPKVRLRMGNDGTKRAKTRWVRGIVQHVTGGPTGKGYRTPEEQWALIVAGRSSSVELAEAIVNYWTFSNDHGGAHLIVDSDCTVIQTADLLTEIAYHATSVNWCTVGIENVRGRKDGKQYRDALDTDVTLTDAVSRLLGIQRQFHKPYRPWKPVLRIKNGAEDVVGTYGHRDQTDGRGPEDPGYPLFDLLEQAGYEPFDYTQNEDLEMWKQRQTQLKQDGYYVGTVDGIAGPGTWKALKLAGYPSGMWVQRPGD